MFVRYPVPPADAYDRDLNPGAVAWFKAASSRHLLERLDGYLRLLDRHDVPWERVETTAPGRIVYEDDVQVVAAPALLSCGSAAGPAGRPGRSRRTGS